MLLLLVAHIASFQELQQRRCIERLLTGTTSETLLAQALTRAQRSVAEAIAAQLLPLERAENRLVREALASCEAFRALREQYSAESSTGKHYLFVSPLGIATLSQQSPKRQCPTWRMQ